MSREVVDDLADVPAVLRSGVGWPDQRMAGRAEHARRDIPAALDRYVWSTYGPVIQP